MQSPHLCSSSRLPRGLLRLGVTRARLSCRPPDSDVPDVVLEGARRRGPPAARAPGPWDEAIQRSVVPQMSYQSRSVAASVAFGIAHLAADFTAGLAEPNKIDGCKLPGNPCVGRCVRDRVRRRRSHVAGSTGKLLRPASTRIGVDVHAVKSGSSLADRGPHGRIVRADVAVHAARMHDNRLYALPGSHPLILAASAEWRDRARGLANEWARDGRWRDKDNREERYKEKAPHGVTAFPQTKSTNFLKGISRRRLPVAAKMALASAGAAGGTGGSPIPRTGPCSSARTSIGGHWNILIPSCWW